MVRTPQDPVRRGPTRAVLVDLLMAVMDSIDVWQAAAGDRRRGLAWRDAVTARMVEHASYQPYERLVEEAGRALGLSSAAASLLFDGWQAMRPWPDSGALAELGLPYVFVTNSSTALAAIAARNSGLWPVSVVTAEDVGWYKPHRRTYEAGCRALGELPEHVLYVAGSAFDAVGARRAGLRVVFVARRPDHRVDDPAIRTVRTMREIAAAIDR
jgi:2-haloacid dehalogenase